jgi:hypothetical protein
MRKEQINKFDKYLTIYIFYYIINLYISIMPLLIYQYYYL